MWDGRGTPINRAANDSWCANSKNGDVSDYLPRARELLLLLIDDPDPDPVSDNPPEGWAGQGDPAAIALNHVRPYALSALVLYACRADEARRGSSKDGEELGPERIEPAVRAALTRKLDRTQEPSQAVHSVYGHHLPLLYWLDQQWMAEHIKDVLPEGEDEQTVRLYVAAWDSYVIFNDWLYAPMLPILRPKYERAIRNLAHGHVTSTHLQPEQHLARHLLLMYLNSAEELPSPGVQHSLIGMFFDEAPAEARGSMGWLAWRFCEAGGPDLERNWTKYVRCGSGARA